MTLSPTTCRICLQTDSRTTNIFFTYSPPDGCATAASAISRYAFVQVLQDDGLPQGICNVCQTELHRTLLFIKLCEKSDKQLRTKCLPQDKFSDVDEPPAPAQLVQIREIPPILNVRSEVEETEPEQTVVIKEEYNPPEEEGIQNEEFEKEFYNDISQAMENKEEHLNFVDVKDIQEDVDMSSDEGMLEEQNFEDEGNASETNINKQSLLPEKSAARYNREYDDFKVWREKTCVIGVTEDDLLVYLNEMSKRFSPSSLWSKWSMLKNCLEVKENVDVRSFHKIVAFLKRQNEHYVPKKAKVFTKEQVENFLVEAPDDKYLLSKIIAIFGIFGTCRCDQLLSLTVNDVEDLGKYIIVNLRNTKKVIKRRFTITDKGCGFNPCALYRKYLALRPPQAAHLRLFLTYHNGKCISVNAGRHTIGGVPRKIAEYLGLKEPNLFTGHSFRRSAATMIADATSGN